MALLADTAGQREKELRHQIAATLHSLLRAFLRPAHGLAFRARSGTFVAQLTAPHHRVTNQALSREVTILARFAPGIAEILAIRAEVRIHEFLYLLCRSRAKPRRCKLGNRQGDALALNGDHVDISGGVLVLVVESGVDLSVLAFS